MNSLKTKDNQLLGWPPETYLDAKQFYFESDFNKVPVPDLSGDWVTLSSRIVSYYDKGGSIKWTVNVSSLQYAYIRTYAQGLLPNLIIVGGYVYFLVMSDYNSTVYRIMKVALSDGSFSVSTSSVSHVDMFVTNNTELLLIGSSNDAKCYRFDREALTTDELPIAPFSVTKYLQNGQYREGAIPLFGGRVLLSRSSKDQNGSYNSHDAVTVTWGINQDLSTTEVSSKKRVHTLHGYSTGMFIGRVQQIGENLYIAGDFSREGRFDVAPVYRPKFFRLSELEDWASESIYEMTGLRVL
ncbi:hypothetical protein [Pseudoalteromonas ruthenica]|uniref:hypothetical protein n=1 Tax=Pseudoalteromonas ruthenica TaxID=151081 RepID=UPI0003469841|nr:hypothetical protein [Pseudoalteromonas ruthenica]